MVNARFIELIGKVFSFLVGLVLIWSSLHHLANPWAFLVTVTRYDMLPYSVSVAVATLLTSFQLTLGCMLCAQQFQRIASVGTALLMLIYLIAQVQALLRGLQISCGCFGSGEEALTVWTVLRTLAFGLVSLIVFVIHIKQEKRYVAVSRLESVS